MTEKLKPTQSGPGPSNPGPSNPDKDNTDGVVNDSLGSISPADSTGLDESRETGDAKTRNKPTRED